MTAEIQADTQVMKALRRIRMPQTHRNRELWLLLFAFLVNGSATALVQLGVPKLVLDRAKEILRNLEESELTPEGNVRQSNRRQRDREQLKRLAPPPQMDLFG